MSDVDDAMRRLSGIFPGFFPTNTKHDHYVDFGFPAKLTFLHVHKMFLRNGVANAAVNKTIDRCWSDYPWLLEYERDGSASTDPDQEDAQDDPDASPKAPKPKKAKRAKDAPEETTLEAEIRKRFDALRFWSVLAEVDRRSLVGRYAGVILRVADGKAFDQPLENVSGGLDALLEIVPAWEGQLAVLTWDENQTSPTYGDPIMYNFTEEPRGRRGKRVVNIHHSRVIIWSRDGTMTGSSSLEAGYNDLVTIEKITGAGGEGFWKTAKAAPVIEVDKEANINRMAQAMGVKPDEVQDAMSKQVDQWSKGFDSLLLLQGMAVKPFNVTLPSPEHFFNVAVQSFAASYSIPMKILVGSQTGERASTEDAKEWNATCNARRNNHLIPNIRLVVKRMEDCGIIRQNEEWFIDWSDLTENSTSDKVALIDKMADINQKMKDTGEFIFTPEEMREIADYEPLSEDGKLRDDPASDGGEFEIDPRTGLPVQPPVVPQQKPNAVPLKRPPSKKA